MAHAFEPTASGVSMMFIAMVHLPRAAAWVLRAGKARCRCIAKCDENVRSDRRAVMGSTRLASSESALGFFAAKSLMPLANAAMYERNSGVCSASHFADRCGTLLVHTQRSFARPDGSEVFRRATPRFAV